MKKLLILYIIIIPITLVAQQTNDELIANEYYLNGQLEKASEIYKKIAEDKNAIPQIHNNYFNVLIELEDYNTAQKYLRKAQKYFPANVYYQIDEGLLFRAMENNEKAILVYNDVIENAKDNKYLIRTVAQYFLSNQLAEYALKSYLLGRKNEKDKNSYALELANTYRILGMNTEMLNEYLNFAAIRPNNLRYIKNILQNLLNEEDEILNFQTLLVEKIQKEPNQKIYGELLIWVNLQQNNFYGAFIQAKAIDKKINGQGRRVMDIGKIAL